MSGSNFFTIRLCSTYNRGKKTNSYTFLTYVPPVPCCIIFEKYYYEGNRYGNTKQEA